jgi:DNA-binding transcriptional regulator PaaX
VTPARKAALQWFHDRGEVRLTQEGRFGDEPTSNMVSRMMNEGLLERRALSPWDGVYSLTDAGRRALHGDPA